MTTEEQLQESVAGAYAMLVVSLFAGAADEMLLAAATGLLGLALAARAIRLDGRWQREKRAEAWQRGEP